MASHRTPCSCSPGSLLSQGACTGGSALHLVHKADARQEAWLSLSLTRGHKSALLPLLTPPRSCCHCPFGAGKPTMTSPRCSRVCLPPSLPALVSLSVQRQRLSSLSSRMETLRPCLGWGRGAALTPQAEEQSSGSCLAQEAFGGKELPPARHRGSGRLGKGSWCSLAAGGASWREAMGSERRVVGRRRTRRKVGLGEETKLSSGTPALPAGTQQPTGSLLGVTTGWGHSPHRVQGLLQPLDLCTWGDKCSTAENQISRLQMVPSASKPLSRTG